MILHRDVAKTKAKTWTVVAKDDGYGTRLNVPLDTKQDTEIVYFEIGVVSSDLTATVCKQVSK